MAYNSELIQGALKTYNNLGSTISRTKKRTNIMRSPKYINTGKYKTLTSTVSGNRGSGKLGTVTVPYGGTTKFEAAHPGIDIANAQGTKIPSFTSGKVTQVISNKKHGDQGYGNYVIVTDAMGGQHRYSHLYQTFVKVGSNVRQGESIGSMGSTGQTYSASGEGEGTHLDYRIKNFAGQYVNPTEYLKNFIK